MICGYLQIKMVVTVKASTSKSAEVRPGADDLAFKEG